MDCDFVIYLLRETFVESLRNVLARLVSFCCGSEVLLCVC